MSAPMLALVEEAQAENMAREVAALRRHNASLVTALEAANAALELVLVNANRMAWLVGENPQVSRRVVIGASEVIAGVAEGALGRTREGAE